MSHSIHQLVYFSTATDLEIRVSEIRKILEKSREKNQIDGIDGVLLFSPRHYFQVLEGPREKITEIFEKIEKDPRHQDVVVLMDRTVETRTFPDLTMGLMGIHENWGRDPEEPEELAPQPGSEMEKSLKKFVVTFERLLKSVGR